MSDTDDGFDEEAARRELREKYEDEREDRETTARMSELLLQGATMTNQHCDRCGSPIFRYDGQEFCPTCQHEAEQQTEAGQQTATDQQAATEQAASQQPEPQPQSEQQPAERTESGESNEPANAHASRTADRRAPPSQTDTEQSAAEGNETPGSAAANHTRAGGKRQSGSDAEDALESSISALARRAASADDPRTATEYLEAAREAAEALAALRHNA